MSKESDEFFAKEPCPDCGSTDNLVRYRDGHAHCFTPGCGRHEKADGRTDGEAKVARPARMTKAARLIEPTEAYAYNSVRGLTEQTLRRYGIFMGVFKDRDGKAHDVRVFPYFDQSGDLAWQKIRFKDKSFLFLPAYDGPPPPIECKLFGQQVFGQRLNKRVVVCVGEYDGPSVYQCADAVAVSCPTGDQGAVKALRANYEWLNSFERVILWFDNDEPGQSVVEPCANLFEPGKVGIIKVHGFKDANELLQANKPGDIKHAYWAASDWKPKGIVNAADLMSDFVDGPQIIPAWPYPWPGLQTKMGGMRRGETTFHIGGTSVAKTTVLFHYAAHLIDWQPDGKSKDQEAGGVKIGWIGLEDSLRSVTLGIMSVHAGIRLKSKELPKARKKQIFEATFGARRFEIYDPTTARPGLKAALEYIRYLAKACECSIVFVDPLSMLLAGMRSTNRVADEDYLAQELATLAKQLNIHIHVSHHLRKSDGEPFEEGAQVSLDDMRGSGMFYAFAHNVIAYERDLQGDRPDLLRVRSLKERHEGRTGPAAVLCYNGETGKYCETTEAFPEKQPAARPGFGGFGSSENSNDFGKDY